MPDSSDLSPQKNLQKGHEIFFKQSMKEQESENIKGQDFAEPRKGIDPTKKIGAMKNEVIMIKSAHPKLLSVWKQ